MDVRGVCTGIAVVQRREAGSVADSSANGPYEPFGAGVLGGELGAESSGPSFLPARAAASRPSYCSPSGRKTKFDQILLRGHKTDRLTGVRCYGPDK